MTAWTQYLMSETQVSVSVQAESLGSVSLMQIALVSSGRFQVRSMFREGSDVLLPDARSMPEHPSRFP